MKSDKGFTLLELLIYVGILAVSAALLTGILATTLKVQNRESASNEVTSQLNFVMQNISRLVRESSNIEMATSTATSTLKLRMKVEAKDPTCLSLASGVIKLAEGPGSNPNNCADATSNLTSDRVVVDALNFTKFSQYPGHDTVSVDIQMTYNSQNPQQRATRNLRSAIARVSAATFDSNLLPGSATYEIGQSGSPWKNLYLGAGGLLNLGTSASDPAGQPGSIYYNTASSTFRGYKASAWANLGESQWTASGNNIYNANSGNVGIATTTPGSPLTVAGEIYSSTGGFKFPDGSTQTAAATSGTFPSFSVHKNGTNQTGVANATWTKVTWSTEVWDSNSNFASNAFTPTVTGKYLLTAGVMFEEVSGGRLIVIYKNGVLIQKAAYPYSSASYSGGSVSVVVDANGSTDYFEIYVYQNTGGTIYVSGVVTDTWFMGHKLP